MPLPRPVPATFLCRRERYPIDGREPVRPTMSIGAPRCTALRMAYQVKCRLAPVWEHSQSYVAHRASLNQAGSQDTDTRAGPLSPCI